MNIISTANSYPGKARACPGPNTPMIISFRMETISELRGWLSRSRTKNIMAFCKLCNCNLEAKLSDLRKHVSTKKHSDNAKLISQH